MASRAIGIARVHLAVGLTALSAAVALGVSGEPVVNRAADADGATRGVTDRSDEVVSLRAARATGEPVRVASLTSETAEVFALPDGQLRAEIAAGVQRFRRAGDWVSVNLNLGVGPDGSVAPVAHPNGLRIAGRRGVGAHFTHDGPQVQ